MVGSLYLSLVLLAAVVGAGFSVFAWRNRTQHGASALTVLLFGASLWALSEGLTVARATLDAMTLWTRVSLSVSVVLPLAWLVFVLQYTGKIGRLSRPVLGVLLVEPVLFVALVWTNSNRHNSVWTDRTIESVGGQLNGLSLDFGVAFWGHQAYSLLLITLGVLLLVRMLVRSNQRIRRQVTVLIVAIFIPVLMTVVHIFALLPAGLNPTGVGYILAGLFISVGVLETELARIAPATRDAGREAVLSEIEDAMLILDGEDRLLDANAAGHRLLETDHTSLGQRLAALDEELWTKLDERDGQDEVTLTTDGKRRFYDVRISGLSGAYGVVSGRVVSLRDVTERRQREQRIEVLNRLLRHNIRNELNVVRGKVELTLIDATDEQTEANLNDAIESIDGIVERSDKVGRLSRLLDQEETGTIDLGRELRSEFETGTRHLPEGEVTLDLPEEVLVTGGPSLVAAFNELVTNGLAHNTADSPRVTLALDETASDKRSVVITVADNGPGIDDQEVETIIDGTETSLKHTSGVGLWLVNWLVQRAGGTLSFENTDGCTVSVQLPRPNES
jgi:signal transduction histidine kinase